MLPIGSVSSRELELVAAASHAGGAPRRASTACRFFRAVATDMESGEAVVFRDGDLAQALRKERYVGASLLRRSRSTGVLGDGRLVDNLPVDVAPRDGVDRIIAVNIGTPLAGRETLARSQSAATTQMINIPPSRTCSARWRGLDPRQDLLIAPPLGRRPRPASTAPPIWWRPDESMLSACCRSRRALRLNETDWQGAPPRQARQRRSA